MNILDTIVKEMIKQHEGGETFFDNLDEEVRKSRPVIEGLIDSIPKYSNIIVSGKFGMFFRNYMEHTMDYMGFYVLTVNGGLRKGEKITDLSYLKEDIKGMDFIFLDDSFYSGKTRNVIKTELERLGGKLVETYVAYDGSKVKEDNVHSLYRYYE